MTDRPIVVAGAGAIGCFVGGMLTAGGRRVALLVRPRVKAEIERFGLLLTDFDGSEKKLDPGQLALSEDPAIFHSAGIVLVTVKSADTAGVAEQIAQHAPQDAVIVSLQNGVGNVAVLRERLGGRRVIAGMVPFNVIGMGEGRFHRSTSGDIHVGEDGANTAAALSAPGLVHAREPRHHRRAMGQADHQFEQCAQRLVRYAARRATGEPRLAKAVRRSNGGGADRDESRRHHSGLGDADPVVLDADLAETA
ncbi:2-dehydropantoate 2-reductase [Bradyrhizobium sp. LM3.6]